MKLGFGAWRFFLAFLVVTSHLWAGMFDGPAAYAVWGFFVLSGFLMTYVLSTKYGQTSSGIVDYAFNRFLRIFPSYWLACLIGVVTLMVLPKFGVNPAVLNPQFGNPQNLIDWLKNILLLPLSDGGYLYVPVSGALAVEVGVYLLMPLLAFSRQAAWLGLILSFMLNLKYGLNIQSFPLRYSTFLTCFSVFSLGSLACHYNFFCNKFRAPLLSVVAWILHCFIWFYYDPWPWTIGIYTSAILSIWVVISLFSLKTGRLDAALGDLSYPIYLFHTVIAAWVLLLIHTTRSLMFFLVSFLVTLFASAIIVLAIDRPLKKLKIRKLLKGRN